VQLGGCLEFAVFEMISDENAYERHFATAKNTLLEISKANEAHFQKIAKEYNIQRTAYFTMSIDVEMLETSGEKIMLKDFLGPHYDTILEKPIILGQTNFLNDYFYYDTEVKASNGIDFIKICKEFVINETCGTSIAFAGAFLDPPHVLHIGKNILEHGQYFNQFCELLFSDLKKIEIYKWSVNCSNLFDDGKEWWGAHFWTVYNPIKNIYIGIVASTTD
jgi:hypothetical protein